MKQLQSSIRSRLERKLREQLAEYPRATRCLIGVSGGRDSIALLHLLAGIGYRNLVVCHLDHALRGRSARADARFVQTIAARLGLDVVVEREPVLARAAQSRQSVETAARDARYDFFARVARARKCRVLFLAHHADDQVETFLFNLFRGAGAAGLGAMRFESIRLSGRMRLKILRPLLGVWREEIDDYIRETALDYREDRTNREPVIVRNRMRHQIIPLLEKSFGRTFKKSVWRTAAILCAENEWTSSLVPAVGKQLAVASLRGMPLALQRRTILAWLGKMRVPGITFDDVELVRSLLDPKNPAKVNLPRGRFARRRAGKLFLES